MYGNPRNIDRQRPSFNFATNEFEMESFSGTYPLFNQHLGFVNLNDENFNHDGVQRFAEWFTQEKVDLISVLNFDYFQMNAQGAKNLATLLPLFSLVKTLSLYRNRIGPQGVYHLSVALSLGDNFYLDTIDLRHNKMGPEGCYYLATHVLMRSNKSRLKTVQLFGNKIGPMGAYHLSSALIGDSCIETLDIRHNRLGDDGARHLAFALARNSCLQHLDLGSNQIGLRGIQCLATALPQNNSLHTLDLSMNDKIVFSSQAYRLFAFALHHHFSIHTLKFRIPDFRRELNANRNMLWISLCFFSLLC